MEKVSDNLEGKLDMRARWLMDARHPTSSEMVELREVFAEVARDILRVRTHVSLLQQTVIYDKYNQQQCIEGILLYYLFCEYYQLSHAWIVEFLPCFT